MASARGLGATPAGRSRGPGVQVAQLTSTPAAPPHPPPLGPDEPAPSVRWDPAPPRPDYVRDAAGVHGELRELAAAHPARARLLDVGDSARRAADPGGGHDLLALVLGTRADDPSVPRVLLTAGVHPRETANPRLLLDWARGTLDAAAAGDPARRALLEERTVVVVPLVNPDGLDTVVRGLDTADAGSAWHRGNHGATGAVDLNRNFDNRWGAGSPESWHRNYRGPHAGSEPEVRAIQALGRALRPAGVYDLHSAGEVVLVPAGAPDARAAAELVSRASGYAVSSSDERWPRPVGGGTLKDWAHDQLGAVSLTIETGDAQHQSDAQYADTRARIIPALDALVVTVDGRHAPPSAATELLDPAPTNARPSIADVD